MMRMLMLKLMLMLMLCWCWCWCWYCLCYWCWCWCWCCCWCWCWCWCCCLCWWCWYHSSLKKGSGMSMGSFGKVPRTFWWNSQANFIQEPFQSHNKQKKVLGWVSQRISSQNLFWLWWIICSSSPNFLPKRPSTFRGTTLWSMAASIWNTHTLWHAPLKTFDEGWGCPADKFNSWNSGCLVLMITTIVLF